MASQDSVVWKSGAKSATISQGDRLILLDEEDEWFTVEQIGPDVSPRDSLPLIHVKGEDGRRFVVSLGDIVGVSNPKATP